MRQNTTYDLYSNPEIDFSEYVIQTEDGLSLKLQRFTKTGNSDSVLLLHGLSSSSNMFTAPEWHNLPYYLLNNGYGDVWVLDWRASYHYRDSNSPSDYSVEDSALLDLPPAVSFIQKNIPQRLHVIGHCIGAMIASMAMVKGVVKDIASAIMISVSLYPRLDAGSLIKLLAVPDLMETFFDIKHLEVDPDRMDFQSGQMLIYKAAALTRNCCDNPTCRNLSFIWGSGHESTLYIHKNLHPYTHKNVNRQFGPVSLSYFRHIKMMLHHQSVVSADGSFNYLDNVERIGSPMLLATGVENRCWYDSNPEFHKLLNTFYPAVTQELLEIPEYSHNDMFMGIHSHKDVFPHFVSFMKKY